MENSVAVTRVENIGKMVAEIVFTPGAIGSGVVFIGRETSSYGRLAEAVEIVIG